MSAKLIVESACKSALKEASGAKTVSREALDWLNAQAGLMVDIVAAMGSQTPGGRLMAPGEEVGKGLIDCLDAMLRPAKVALPASDVRDAMPGRICWRGKLVRDMSDDELDAYMAGQQHGPMALDILGKWLSGDGTAMKQAEELLKEVQA
jgi:hypothetical protein